jgi:S-adenosylmethionine synthetase
MIKNISIAFEATITPNDIHYANGKYVNTSTGKIYDMLSEAIREMLMQAGINMETVRVVSIAYRQ